MEQDRKIITGVIKTNSQIAEDVFEMVITTDTCKDFVPGQFINIYLDDKSMMLPRPISICDANEEHLTLIYKVIGNGTKHLSSYSINQKVSFSTPLGNGYHLREDYDNRTVSLVAGGIGAVPLVGLANELNKRHAVIDVFLGFQSEVLLTDKFEKSCRNTYISTNNGSIGFFGNILDFLKTSKLIYDDYFACGPRVMLKAVCEYVREINRTVQISIEERMGCGYGACLGCSCEINENGKVVKKSVCKHGPIFWGDEVVFNKEN